MNPTSNQDHRTHSHIVQTDDYYPFGLTFNGWQRAGSLGNGFKFQGQERIDDLGLKWDSFKWRNHQPDIGRFFNGDPLAEDYVYNSPYAFSENKVISHVEIEGLEAERFMKGINLSNKAVSRTTKHFGRRDATPHRQMGSNWRVEDVGVAAVEAGQFVHGATEMTKGGQTWLVHFCETLGTVWS